MFLSSGNEEVEILCESWSTSLASSQMSQEERVDHARARPLDRALPRTPETRPRPLLEDHREEYNPWIPVAV